MALMEAAQPDQLAVVTKIFHEKLRKLPDRIIADQGNGS